ncbi:paraquat-inducible protein A [Luteolibacter flavescens]|uniref:Paraquat-inducible protein A n=1 Tax=Luteolibacter flavescens TaxID=1859460 RepID=A0ABT3FIH6_9BACT|nr:paraquat-inducible protein A [Luteolibacter flavescens]MCW1883154.1 paraquat-inducible protein A [Luteolibacter flavescens]
MKRHLPGLSWPRIEDGPIRVACHFCDALQDAPRLKEGDAAHCCRCGEVLYQNRPRSLARATGFSSAALIFMALVHLFPSITVNAGSVRRELTILEAAQAMWRDGNPAIAAATVFFTMVAPLVLVGGLLYVTAPLRFGIAFPGAKVVTRWYQLSEPWSMLEVFLFGILVALLKLGAVGDIHLGVGLWAMAGLVICTTSAIAGIDRLELWDRLEIAFKRTN